MTARTKQPEKYDSEMRVESEPPELELRSDRSSSIGLYLTSEKARDSIYDQFAAEVSELENYDEFIGEKIRDRVEALEYASENYDEFERVKFAAEAMDDESTWLASRYPQFVGGTLLGIGGAIYSAVKGDVELGSALALGTGSFMTYTAFNGTPETIDKVLTFNDSIEEQQQIWEQALEEHEENGFDQKGSPTREVNQKMLHPVGADHNIAVKDSEGRWRETEFADSFSEVIEKHGKKEVGWLLYQNARTVFPKYVGNMIETSTESTREKLSNLANYLSRD